MPNAVLYRRAEAEACWRNIAADVLIISGDKSPFAGQFPDLGSSGLPGSELYVITGAGHMIHFEAPGRLAKQIEQFLKKTL
jgi:pimeloyl-ACP methyl ester carboxylesterase